jgi:hypothetical protein
MLAEKSHLTRYYHRLHDFLCGRRSKIGDDILQSVSEPRNVSLSTGTGGIIWRHNIPCFGLIALVRWWPVIQIVDERSQGTALSRLTLSAKSAHLSEVRRSGVRIECSGRDLFQQQIRRDVHPSAKIFGFLTEVKCQHSCVF